MSFSVCQSHPFGFSIIAKYYLFSKVVQYIILEYISTYHSSPPSSVRSILDTMAQMMLGQMLDNCNVVFDRIDKLHCMGVEPVEASEERNV